MVQWSSTASDEAILTNGPGFESGDSQLEFEVRNVPIVLFGRVPTWSLDLISYALFGGRFIVCQPGPWRQKRHFEVNNFPFQANDGVLKSSRPPASIP